MKKELERIASVRKLRLKYHTHPVAREGGRTLFLRHELRDGDGKVVALYAMGHRHLFWHKPTK